MLVGSNARLKFGDKRGPRIPVMLLIHQPCRGRLPELVKTTNRGGFLRQGELRPETLIFVFFSFGEETYESQLAFAFLWCSVYNNTFG